MHVTHSKRTLSRTPLSRPSVRPCTRTSVPSVARRVGPQHDPKHDVRSFAFIRVPTYPGSIRRHRAHAVQIQWPASFPASPRTPHAHVATARTLLAISTRASRISTPVVKDLHTHASPSTGILLNRLLLFMFLFLFLLFSFLHSHSRSLLLRSFPPPLASRFPSHRPALTLMRLSPYQRFR